MTRLAIVRLGMMGLVATSGCRDEQTSNVQPARPDAGLGVSATRPMDPQEPPPAGDAEPSDDDGLAAAAVGDGCAGGPAWTAITRCSEGSHLYAVGKVERMVSPDLARTTAANRARALLAAADPLELTEPRSLARVEILEHARCGNAMHALARMPYSEDPGVGPCPAGSTTIVADGDDAKPCPGWTNRGVWVEGSELIAVASARAGNAMLAEKMARNRAAAEVAGYAQVTIANKGGALQVSSTGVLSLVPGEAEKATCDGVVYVKVRHALPEP